MDVREVLQGARDRVAAGWTQGDYEREIGGQKCFCARGAILDVVDYWKADLENFEQARLAYLAAHRVLETVLPPRFGVNVVKFNDDPDRTQDEVVALFDAALEAVSA